MSQSVNGRFANLLFCCGVKIATKRLVTTWPLENQRLVFSANLIPIKLMRGNSWKDCRIKGRKPKRNAVQCNWMQNPRIHFRCVFSTDFDFTRVCMYTWRCNCRAVPSCWENVTAWSQPVILQAETKLETVGLNDNHGTSYDLAPFTQLAD